MTFAIPKSLGACVDLYYKIRAERIAEEKKITAMKENERALVDHICAEMPKDGVTGIRGKVANFTTTPIEVATVKDWDKLHAYIKKNDAFYLLQRRVSDTAMRELWALGKKVPGVEKFPTYNVSCTKL